MPNQGGLGLSLSLGCVSNVYRCGIYLNLWLEMRLFITSNIIHSVIQVSKLNPNEL
jgi:hypothetical protein